MHSQLHVDTDNDSDDNMVVISIYFIIHTCHFGGLLDVLDFSG